MTKLRLFVVAALALMLAAADTPAHAQTRAYVNNPGVNSNSISVIDTATNTVIATIPHIGEGNYDLAITPDGRHAYVTNFYNVAVIDTGTNTVTATVGVGAGPKGVAITPSAYTVLYNFGSHSGDPTGPQNSGIIAEGRDGNLYSTADDHWSDQLGTAFKITPAGALTVLHHFSGPDGKEPISGLTLGTDGYFYGTTRSGGLYSHGTVFKVTAGGTVTTIYNFTGGVDGGDPGAPPIQGLDGNFYGTTATGGNVGNTGTIYKITSSGWFTTLHSFGFTSNFVNGEHPNAQLLQGADGYLYGTTVYGGTHDMGTVFRTGYSGQFKTLFNFDGPHGTWPQAQLIEGSDRNLYGMTARGGNAGGGVLYKITPTGTLTILRNFDITNTIDGFSPVGGLMQATDGNLYGICVGGGTNGWGVLFRVSSTGAYTVLHHFDWNTGGSPQAMLFQHTNGLLYSTTAVGGTGNSGEGTFYSFAVGLPRFVRFVRNFLPVGHKIEFLGQGFTGTTGVSFAGTAAAFTVVSDTYLTATVPEGASSGFVSVTTPKGTLWSDKRFLVKPQILSFSPASGPAGTQVVINGVSLKQTWKVVFEGYVAANFKVISDNQVIATVPAGAKTGKVGIITTGAPVYSAATFTVTP